MKKTILQISLVLGLSHFGFAQQIPNSYTEISGNSTADILAVSKTVEPYVYQNAIDLSDLDVQKKKQAFIHLMLPTILIAKYELEQNRKYVQSLIDKSQLDFSEQEYLTELQKSYKCKSNKELLSRMQTHPTSIILAQAAIESGWGTSRFYKEANNIFGVWSYSKNEARIKASVDREGKSIYVKKYDSLPRSILSYFKTLARGPYSEFRAAREKTSNVYELIPHLKVYSELREEYVKRLDQLIKYNKLEQYDEYILKMNN
jgi:Bax protein